MTRSLISIILIIASTGLVQAQRTYIIPGRPKTDIHVIHDSLMYITSNTFGIYEIDGKSTSGRRLPYTFPFVQFLATRAQNDTVWVGTSDGLFKLHNTVLTQFKMSFNNFPADTVFQLEILNNTLIAGTNAGLVIQNGEGWSLLNSANSSLLSNRITRIKKFGNKLGLLAGGIPHVYENGQIQAFSLPINETINQVQPINQNELIVLTSGPMYRIEANGRYSTITNLTQVHDVQVKNDSLLFLVGSKIYVYFKDELSYWNVIIPANNPLSTSAIMHLRVTEQGRVYVVNDLFVFVQDSLMLRDDNPNSQNRRSLNINQVEALYMTNGDMFWDRNGTSQPRYNVPRVLDTVESRRHTLFALSPWFGGKSNNILHQTGQLYRSTHRAGIGYRSGPLNDQAQIFPNEVRYDRLWKIDRSAIEQFKEAWKRGQVQNGSYYPSFDFRDWPGNRPDGSRLAPFFDKNNDGIYRYTDGDYPIIKGDQAIWMVFHDKDPNRIQDAPPLGIEVQCLAYAYLKNQNSTLDSALNYTTFLDYRVINRSSNSYSNTYFAVWADGDIGSGVDDYVGMDVQGNGFYFYNGVPEDTCTGCYGSNPPAQGIFLLRGPNADANDGKDNNRNGTIDEINEDVAFSSFMHFQNNDSLLGNPVVSDHFYSYARGIWKDNNEMVFGGNAYPGTTGATTLNTKFQFPGNSDPLGWGLGGSTENPISPPFIWSETNLGPGSGASQASDRRGLAGIGEFYFPAGAEKSFTLALIYSRGNNGPESSVQKLLTQDAPHVKKWYAQNMLEQLKALAYPNPFKDLIQIRVSSEDELQVLLTDIHGRVILNQKFSGALNYEIDTNNLFGGIYIVRLMQKDSSNAFKLVKN